MNHNTLITYRSLSRACMLSMFALTFVFIGNDAYALNLCPMIDTLFTTGVAPGIATIGVIGLGIGATFGKVTWGMAVMVAVGIAAMFGAGSLANSVYANGGCP
jgi:type IV secretory pathway VirB2 component (pilin)